jgi:hypothetical protein
MTTIRRFITSVIGLAVLISYTAPAALAQRPEPPSSPVPQAPSVTPTVVEYGSPIWQFALVAAAAMIVTVLLTIAVHEVRKHRWAGASMAHA